MTTHDAGGPLEVVVDRENGIVCEPEPVGGGRRVLVARGQPGPGPCPRPSLASSGRSVSPGTPSSTVSSAREGRVLLAVSARALGDRRLQRAALPGAAAAARRRRPSSAERRSRRAARTSRSTTSATTPRLTAWIVEALRRRAGDRRPARLRPAPPRRRDDARAGDSEGYLDAMQRDSGVVGGMLAHGVVDNLLPPIWEERAAGLPAHARGARPAPTASSATRATSSGA